MLRSFTLHQLVLISYSAFNSKRVEYVQMSVSLLSNQQLQSPQWENFISQFALGGKD
jgi:hypothetical protein